MAIGLEQRRSAYLIKRHNLYLWGMSIPPAEVWFFRIIHIDNLEFALCNGLFAGGHPDRDENYVFIGDTSLTSDRFNHPVPLAGDMGSLGEYVPFYLGPRSPMLYQIYTGYGGITRRRQEDIVYLCCRMTDMQNAGLELLLTDGHAKAATTSFLTPEDDLAAIDWVMAKAKSWSNNEEDWDRQRRKQAEGLVRNHVPASCISFVLTKNEASSLICNQIVLNLNIDQQVKVKVQSSFYY